MDDQTLGSDSSDDLDQTADVTQDNLSDVNSDPNSSGGSNEGEMDLLSVVRDAAPDVDETASPADQHESEPTEQAGAQEKEQPTDDTVKADGPKDPDDFSDVPFNEHPRFQRLVRERNQYKESAQQYEQVQNFLAENGITAEEAADQLTLLAKMKTDPHGAWTEMKPMVQKLLIEAGEALPQDLREQVQAKRLSPEQALEISRLRAKDAARDRQAEHDKQVQATRSQREAQAAIQSNIAEWEMSVRGKDPDFDRKADALRGRILSIHQTEGMAKTAEQALDQVQRAYNAVNETFSSLRPPKPAVTPILAGRAQTGSPSDGPRSMLDIVKGAQAAG